MTEIFLIFIAFIGIGLFARSFNGKVRLLLFIAIASMIVYITVK